MSGPVPLRPSDSRCRLSWGGTHDVVWCSCAVAVTSEGAQGSARSVIVKWQGKEWAGTYMVDTVAPSHTTKDG